MTASSAPAPKNWNLTPILEGNRRAVAKAITLLESTRADHRAQADELLTALLPHTGKSFRLGISGVPGVGKSTFIEALGLALIAQGHRVAVLASSSAIDHLQARLPGLATIGAVSPFVGLFGTVWGIMNSFQGIAASNNTSLAVVAPGIAEALFATALGLVAAIPAVIFYNRISGDIGAYGKRLNAFIGVFEVELSRQLSRKGDRNGLRVA